MSPTLAAHLRLLARLPVRTHEAKLPCERHQGARIGAELPPHLIDEYLRLAKAKLRDREVCKVMQIGSKTLKRLKRAVQTKDK